MRDAGEASRTRTRNRRRTSCSPAEHGAISLPLLEGLTKSLTVTYTYTDEPAGDVTRVQSATVCTRGPGTGTGTWCRRKVDAPAAGHGRRAFAICRVGDGSSSNTLDSACTCMRPGASRAYGGGGLPIPPGVHAHMQQRTYVFVFVFGRLEVQDRGWNLFAVLRCVLGRSTLRPRRG